MVGDLDSLGFLTILLNIVLRITQEQFGGMFGMDHERVITHLVLGKIIHHNHKHLKKKPFHHSWNSN